jgi:hypothetical protein
MTKSFQRSIIAEAQDALRFLPVEDKVNLAFAVAGKPCIDDKDHMAQLLSDSQDMIEDLSNTVTTLQDQLSRAVKDAG